MQKFYEGLDSLKNIIETNNFKKILIVSSEHILKTPFVFNVIKDLKIDCGYFTNFTPNPKMEEAEEGLEFYKKGNFETILAIGGGSALDVSKYIKLYAETSLIAVPTTAGSGSESTRFSVIYKDGEKLSINSLEIIPEYVILESKFLETLPEYQKKSTILDALCHSIESFWSINSTEKSKEISKQAIELILKNYEDYINNKKEVYSEIMRAANLAGQAINITQTTAGHALSYKLTSVFNIAHGHAVAITLKKVWEYLNNHQDLCCDARGKEYLSKTLSELSKIIDINQFNSIVDSFNLEIPKFVDDEQLNIFVNSVNVERLGNFPIKLTTEAIRELYLAITEAV